MDFNLFSKKSLGSIATLFLVILLSQSRFLNFLIETSLGRAILILFILGISFTNKILGIVAVLFIIIAFNNSDIGYLEGFTNPANIAKTQNVNVDDKKKTNNKSVEGFNINEREHTMLKGKQSSSVPVYPNARNQTENVEPTDKTTFTENYSSL